MLHVNNPTLYMLSVKHLDWIFESFFLVLNLLESVNLLHTFYEALLSPIEKPIGKIQKKCHT